jgi:hypothetical protein
MSCQKIKSFLTKNMGLEYSKHLKGIDSRVGYIGIKLHEKILDTEKKRD